MPGKKVVILGSGDIGLIMARRMTLEGAEVKAVAELMPYSGGLKRNIVQCLDDFGIPLKLSHTVVDIKGKERVEGITLAEVDENRRPIPGTEEFFECDTLRKCSSCSRSGGFCFGGSRQCRKKCGSLYKQQWRGQNTGRDKDHAFAPKRSPLYSAV